MTASNAASYLVLRGNAGMIRDVFVAEDKSAFKEGPILVIRQIKFNDDGSDGETKIIRLTLSEAEMLMTFWRDCVKPK